MAKRMKFTIGGARSGYKTIELLIDGGTFSYKILRSGLLDVDKNSVITVQAGEDWLDALEEFDIFSWEEVYTSEERDGTQWELIFEDGDKIYHGRGSNAYPSDWESFLDWLDALCPELEFIDRKRIDGVYWDYLNERLVIYRNGLLVIVKSNSNHMYEFESTKKIFEACQRVFEGVEVEDTDLSVGSRVHVEILRHDESLETFETLYNENFLPGISDLLEMVRAVASDLTATILMPDTAQIASASGKYILCKVQFKGSYKPYTYRTEDATLAVGDEVDVPVGRNNDVAQARIIEIGCFDEYELPYPIDKIKMVIGKHVMTEWGNLQ